MQSCKRADKFRPEPETISPNPKINLKPKSCPKKPESWVMSKKFSNIAKLFWLFFCTSKTKSTSQARFKPEIFFNFRPRPEKPGPTYNSGPMSNQIFHYTRWIMPKRVTSLRGPSSRHCARTTQLLSKKCRSGGESLATPSDLNLRPLFLLHIFVAIN